jgi:quercetin dioxygenase-like cupin family protein
MTIAFAATEDVIAPGQRLALKPAARALYLRHGRVVIAQYGTATTLAEGHCALIVGAATLTGDGIVWGCEATRDLASPDPLRTVLHVRLPRDPDAPLLLRADRVDFPPGAVTPRHGHAGPGIRRLLAGRLFAEIGATHRRIDAGEAWFESGPEPVVGHNIAPASAFVRCMVLDPDLLGRPTFRPTSPEDAARPRAVGYRQFFDTIVTLPP